ARLGSGERVTSLAEFSARMVDRVGLLTPRLALAGARADLQAVDALRDLRVGLNMTMLQSVRPAIGRADAAVATLMTQLARRFARLPALAPDAEAQLLEALDNALRAVCRGAADAARREALAALTGMRRDLFPGAPAYVPAHLPNLSKEIR
ncbi:FUSC family protein, partial [uncultured Massilia sp.]